jgi:hypothetical protein
LDGVKAKEGQINQQSETQLFVGDLPNGIYLLRILVGNGFI